MSFGAERARTQRALTRGTAKRLPRKRAKPRPDGALARWFLGPLKIRGFLVSPGRSHAKFMFVLVTCFSDSFMLLESSRLAITNYWYDLFATRTRSGSRNDANQPLRREPAEMPPVWSVVARKEPEGRKSNFGASRKMGEPGALAFGSVCDWRSGTGT
jgi:hypothetical protein